MLLNGTVLEDPSPIGMLPRLLHLQIQGWESIPDISRIPLSRELSTLGMGDLPADTDLNQLNALTNLRRLILEGSGRPRGLRVLRNLKNLDRLTLTGFDMRKDLTAFSSVKSNLSEITLARCQMPDDISPLNSLSSMRRLEFRESTGPDGPLNLAGLADRDRKSNLIVSLRYNQEARRPDNLGPRKQIIRQAS